MGLGAIMPTNATAKGTKAEYGMSELISNVLSFVSSST